MRISSVRIYPINSGDLVAYASIVFDDQLVLHDIEVVNEGKLIVRLPGYVKKDGNFKSICHPTNKELFNDIVSAVLKEF